MVKIISSATSDLVVDQRVHRSCKTLTEMGFEVSSIGRIKPDSKALSKREYKTIRLKCFINSGPLFYVEYNTRLFLKLLFSKCDVLLSNDLDTLLANSIVSKIRGIPLVYDSHEYFTEVPELIHRPSVRKIWLMIEKMCINRPSKYMTVCNSISVEYGKKYGLEFSVIRNLPEKLKEVSEHKTVDLRSMANGRRILLYQGSVNADRGLEEMVQAMKLLDDYLLVIAGKGDVYKDLLKQVEALKLNDKVKFLGQIPFEELPSITSQADLGLSIEKKDALSYQFALPNKVFDYLQSSIPVLMSDLIELKALNERYHFAELIEEIQPELIAQKIKNIFTVESKLIELKENAIKASKELNWEIERKKFESIFRSFLDRE